MRDNVPSLKTLRRPKRVAAFTLIELMVSTAVVALMMILFSQVIMQTSGSMRLAHQRIDTASMCRVALDRIGLDLSRIVPGNESPLIVVKGDATTSDSVVMIGNVRTQDRGLVAGDLRLGVVAYCIRTVDNLAQGIGDAQILSRGNGTITWAGTNTKQIGSDTLKALQMAVVDVSGASQQMVSFQPLGEGIFRSSISFLLSDGSLTSTPPRDKNFLTISNGNANVYPLARCAAASDDATQRYVRALIVAVVALDERTLKNLDLKGVDMKNLAKLFVTGSSTTPAQDWDVSGTNTQLRSKLSPPAYPPSVVGGVRVYQRYFYVQ